MWEALVCVAAQLSVRLLFLPGMRRGMEGLCGCYLGLWGYHLGCVAVRASVRTVPLFAGGLAFYEAVLAFSAAYFGVVVEVVLWAVGSVGRKVGMVWFSGGVFVFFGGF